MNPQRDFRARLPRRVAAMSYDALLLAGVLFAATFALLPLVPGALIEPGNVPFMLYLLAVAWLYFCWHWTHGGQTLGMKAWRLRLRARDGSPVSVSRATLRFFCAGLCLLPAAAGLFWALFDRDGLALHDRMSRTVLELTRED